MNKKYVCSNPGIIFLNHQVILVFRIFSRFFFSHADQNQQTTSESLNSFGILDDAWRVSIFDLLDFLIAYKNYHTFPRK